MPQLYNCFFVFDADREVYVFGTGEFVRSRTNTNLQILYLLLSEERIETIKNAIKKNNQNVISDLVEALRFEGFGPN